MGKVITAAEKPRIGWFGWTIRILGGTVLVCVLAFASFIVYFRLAVYPKQLAEQAAAARRAQAFAKLTGAARRLAIYDAFVAQIDRNYYDQSFSGFDWRKMERDWRPRAAAAKDDWSLYWEVFFQMTQRFLVGRATNGSVQGAGFFALPDGGQVEVAVDDTETLHGKRLDNVGVTPDIEIYPTLDAIRAGRDVALEAAEAALSSWGHVHGPPRSPARSSGLGGEAPSQIARKALAKSSPGIVP